MCTIINLHLVICCLTAVMCLFRNTLIYSMRQRRTAALANFVMATIKRLYNVFEVRVQGSTMSLCNICTQVSNR